MQLATITLYGVEIAAVRVQSRGLALLPGLGDDLPQNLLSLLRAGLDDGLRAQIEARAAEMPSNRLVPLTEAVFAPLYRDPEKILGIGLNYRAHAGDLNAPHPDEPASFLKANHTIIGHEDAILLPDHSEHVTAEAELGLVLGRVSGPVEPAEALDALIGVCTILDQTAVDILQRNPRFLTRSKNYRTFFSFGPYLTTIDEVRRPGGTLGQLTVGTYANGRLVREDLVRNMAYSPESLISLHSEIMPFRPGDLISSGSPGAVRIRPGDFVECRITGLEPLRNAVASGGRRQQA